MENQIEQTGQCGNQIREMLDNIEKATMNMSVTFEQAILRHEEQFIKAYRMKVAAIVKLFDQLKKIIEENTVQNTLTHKLETVIKERDYFKYQCLKLKTQNQNLSDEYKNVNRQAANTIEEMSIYKQLLQNEKIRHEEVRRHAEEIKSNFTELAQNSILRSPKGFKDKEELDAVASMADIQKENNRLKREIHQLSESIRLLKEKNSCYSNILEENFETNLRNKELMDVFRCCVDAWKRQLITKSRKSLPSRSKDCILSPQLFSAEPYSVVSKKELLRSFFTNPKFLSFLDDLLFNPHCVVTFQTSDKPDHLESNRSKVLNYIKRRNVQTSHSKMR